MGSQPSRRQVIEQQPAVSLKSKSVFLQISLITFHVRRKGHVHKQEVFDITFIVFKKLLISDLYCTRQGCQQSCHANQKVFICILLSGLFCVKNMLLLHLKSHFRCITLPVSTCDLPPFQAAMTREGSLITVRSRPSFFYLFLKKIFDVDEDHF